MLKFCPLLILLLALFAASVFAQDDDPIRVDSAIVRVNVGVVDRTGRAIINLRKEDFNVFENGVKQEITTFEYAPSPFSIVMLLDMSGSTRSFRQNIRLSATRFIDALGPQDRLAVVEFYSKINLLNDFTTNRQTAAHSISVAGGAGETDLYKALLYSLNKLSKESNRRKAIVVLTDGVDTESRNSDRKKLAGRSESEILSLLKPETDPSLNRILRMADAEGVTIYPLALPTGDPARLADPTPLQVALFKAARTRLKMIADRTGGTLSEIQRLEHMAVLYANVAADLKALYTIEYQPLDTKKDGKWRSIRVEVADPALIARSRQGYFPKD